MRPNTIAAILGGLLLSLPAAAQDSNARGPGSNASTMTADPLAPGPLTVVPPPVHGPSYGEGTTDEFTFTYHGYLSAPILVADDEKNDIFFLRRAFQKAGLNALIIGVPDGEEVEKYLSGEDSFSDRSRFPLPGLLVLDIKMPKRDGFDVLKWLQGRDELKDMTVVMLSSSSQDSDIRRARELGARDYFVKPSDFEQLTELVQTIAQRWLNGST